VKARRAERLAFGALLFDLAQIDDVRHGQCVIA
jgi:hypothetical protein